MEVLEAPAHMHRLLCVRATPAQITGAFGQALMDWLNRETDKPQRFELALPRHLAGYVKKIEAGPLAYAQRCGETITSLPVSEAASGVDESPQARRGGNSRDTALATGMAPRDIAEIYRFPPDVKGHGETIALMMLGNDLVRESDVLEFWRYHGITPPEVHIVHIGAKQTRQPHPLQQLEAAMTVQWAGAMAPEASLVVYCIDPSIMGDPWSAFLFEVVGDRRHKPTVASTSWITREREYYARHGHGVITGLLEQAAALGITVICAAGDWGVSDGIPRMVGDGRYVNDAAWPHGVFPAVESRVVSVGGTMITHRDPLTEMAWSGPPPCGVQKALNMTTIAGSGGFSEAVPIPAWQRPLLRGYYARGVNSPAVIPYGRGYPDVALMAAGPSVQKNTNDTLSAQGYQAVVDGEWIDYAGGTSVGSAIWAAITARLNEARCQQGQNRLGQINPLLYRLSTQEPKPFREITAGRSDVSMYALNQQGKPCLFSSLAMTRL